MSQTVDFRYTTDSSMWIKVSFLFWMSVYVRSLIITDLDNSILWILIWRKNEVTYRFFPRSLSINEISD
jgi:hypothetical protein